ncbi:PH domain-containing protein [Lederbergia sp. NSJ-179]|uniref:PH domain-containing protein n=1 Tax=Lederbergia sp. NSJ-179 TaxID=2931402 RepID=UPI001FD055AA|nr:PH domain-containing protein [Lederbergia sp. NSJ-179]MCJ7842187.1 PH domain-containing protein [Lederbergia sp. NSJ-179]
MSEPKRLHPIMILLDIVKSIKDVIVPIFIYFFIFFFKEPSDNIWLRLSPYIFVGIMLIMLIVTNVISWLRYTYRLENNELRIEYGLFVKKKRYIPFERIQSLDFSETIFHRPFGLVKVKVETAGGNHDEAEAEMTAIKKAEADAIKQIIAQAKDTGEISENADGELETESNKEAILYKISRKQLLFFASTSGRAGVIISAVIAFLAQFEEIIPFKAIFHEMENIVKAGLLIVTLIVCCVLVLAWLLSVVWAYLKYNDFTLKWVNNEFVITRGLLEKRTTTIPARRVQAIKISETPFRQPFGYASVSVEYAGGSITDDNQFGMLMPVVKKKEIAQLLEQALPDYSLDVDLTSVPRRAKRRYYFLKMFFLALLTTGLSIWLWPYSLFSLLLVPLAWVWGHFQYRSAGWNLTNQQLVLRSRDIQQETVYLRKNRIQSMDIEVNWFQKRANLATIHTTVMSGGLGSAKVKHVEVEDARKMYQWYRPDKKPGKRNEVHGEEPQIP